MNNVGSKTLFNPIFINYCNNLIVFSRVISAFTIDTGIQPRYIQTPYLPIRKVRCKLVTEAVWELAVVLGLRKDPCKWCLELPTTLWQLAPITPLQFVVKNSLHTVVLPIFVWGEFKHVSLYRYTLRVKQLITTCCAITACSAHATSGSHTEYFIKILTEKDSKCSLSLLMEVVAHHKERHYASLCTILCIEPLTYIVRTSPLL